MHTPRLLDKLILALASIFLIISSLLIWGENLFLAGENVSGLEKIGSVINSENDVRRKLDQDFIWRGAKTKDTVFLGDSLFTGDESLAKLVLDDGTELDIMPNSLIVLRRKPEGLVLSLEYGNLKGNLTSNTLILKSGEEVTELTGKGSQIEIKKAKKGGVNVAVLAGALNVKTKEKSSTLEKNQQLDLLKNGLTTPPTKIITLNLKTPLQGETVWFTEPSTVDFSWTNVPEAKNFLLELSMQSDFNENVEQITTNKLNYKILIKKPNNYYWRVTAEDKNGNKLVTSSVQTLLVNPITTPLLKAPADNWKLDVVEDKDKTLTPPASVTLEWTDEMNSSQAWQLRLAQDPGFKQIIKEIEVREKSVVAENLPHGKIYWNVRSGGPNRPSSPWSKTGSFEVNIKFFNPPLPPPILTNPEITMEVPENPQSALPELQWSKINKAKGYIVELSTNESFNNILEKFELKNTKAQWKKYQTGSYFWRVYAVSNENVPGQISKTGHIAISLPKIKIDDIPPVIMSGDPNIITPSQPVTLKWNAIPLTKEYKVEWADNNEFKNATPVVTPTTSTQVTMPRPGQYFWRVQPLDEKKKPLQEFTSPKKMSYTIILEDHAIKLISPTDKMTYVFQKRGNDFVWFNWTSIDKASEYELQLSSTADFQKPMDTIKTTQLGHMLRKTLPLGKIYWRVRAKVNGVQTSWTPSRNFIMNSIEEKTNNN